MQEENEAERENKNLRLTAKSVMLHFEVSLLSTWLSKRKQKVNHVNSYAINYDSIELLKSINGGHGIFQDFHFTYVSIFLSIFVQRQ